MKRRSILIRAANWQSFFLYQFRCSWNRNLGYNFQTLFARKRVLAHPYFFMKINHFDIVFDMTWEEWRLFQSLRSGFSKGFVFSQDQVSGLGPGFRTMSIVLFVFCLFHNADQITEPKQLNRSKATSPFFRRG